MGGWVAGPCRPGMQEVPLQVDAVQRALFWVSAVSLVSCGLVLCSWALNADLRRFAFNLITLLALCQAGAAASYTFFIDPRPSSPECIAQVRNKPGLPSPRAHRRSTRPSNHADNHPPQTSHFIDRRPSCSR